MDLDCTSKEPAAAAVEKDGAAGMERKKFCTACRTTKTPLWRLGPSGPKSLCNACGIRYRKKTTVQASNSGSQSHELEAEKEKKKMSKSVKIMSLVILGKKQRRQRKRKLREEEIAAASLVALSCASVFS